MRDEHDTYTIGIGAIELLPGPAPARLTEPQRRAAQGYMGPKQRDGCHNCRSFDLRVQAPDTPFERLVTVCRRGNFRCEKSGACTHWSLDTRRAARPAKDKTPCARMGVYSADDEAADQADLAKVIEQRGTSTCSHPKRMVVKQAQTFLDWRCDTCGTFGRETWD